MALKKKYLKYLAIMAMHEWIGSLFGYCCICDFCKKGRELSHEWVELTREDPSLVFMD